MRADVVIATCRRPRTRQYPRRGSSLRAGGTRARPGARLVVEGHEPDPAQAAELERVGHSAGPDELPEVLPATSPLLARAFGATGHQRAVLTQRGPAGPAETSRDEE